MTPPPSNARCQLIDGDYPLHPEAPNAFHREEWLDAGHLSSWDSPVLWRSSRRLLPETVFFNPPVQITPSSLVLPKDPGDQSGPPENIPTLLPTEGGGWSSFVSKVTPVTLRLSTYVPVPAGEALAYSVSCDRPDIPPRRAIAPLGCYRPSEDVLVGPLRPLVGPPARPKGGMYPCSE